MLQGIIAQSLVPRSDRNGRVAAVEVMLGTDAVNVVCHAKRKKLTSKIQKNPPEKKLPGGFKTYLNGFIMPF